MSAIGGPIESVNIAGREFPVAADADINRDLGGFSNEIQSNGDGSSRTIKTRKPWMVEGLSISTDDDRGDEEFLQDVADSSENVPMLVRYPSGKIYQGTGTITGDIKSASASATTPVTLSGPGKLTPQ